MGRLLGRLFAGFTTCLIAFIAYSSQIFVIWPWYGRELSVDLLKLLVPFNLLVGMLYWNYYLCVTTDPGRVPKNWEPDVHSSTGYEVKRLTGNPRFCRMCNAYKPPRTHHCKECRRCVLRMDHHCPWVNNCVGFYNYGHFLRFLFFVDVACSYHITMLVNRTIEAMNANYWEGPDTVEFVFVILNFVTCMPVLLAVGGFSLYHFYCLSTNTTTIEGWEKDKVATLVKKGRIHEVRFPYNIGMRNNIEAILGKNPLLWCWPSFPLGNGTSFPVVEADDESAQPWPPEDPTRHQTHPDYANGDDHELVLPDSPWTFENGSLNPALEPSNTRRRGPGLRNRAAKSSIVMQTTDTSDVPPYHPDYGNGRSRPRYDTSSDEESGYDSDEMRYNGGGDVSMNIGEEGYEVREIDREEILRRYIMSRGQEAGHYRRYDPNTNDEYSDRL